MDMALADHGSAGEYDPLDDRWSYALFGAWTLAIQHEDFVAGRVLALRALANAKRSGKLHQLGQAEFMIGLVALYQPDYPVARRHLHASLDITARSAYALGNAWTLTFVGATEIAAGDLAAARGPLERSVAVHRTTGDKVGLGHSMQYLGVLTAAAGDFPAAQSHLTDSLTAYREAGSDSWLSSLLDLFAGIAAAQADFFRATCLAGAAAAQRDVATPPLPLIRPQALEFDALRVRETVGEPAFAEAWSRGQAMTLDAAVDFALAPPTHVGRAMSAEAGSVSTQLTPREREVVSLLASGVSNRRLADKLVITEGTAKLHVKHILKKLGLRSRSDVAAWALRHGLNCLATYT
jgi:DNA-binding CsgD family transcriptional regulator